MASSGLNYYLVYCPFIMLASAYKSIHKKSLQDSNDGGDINTPYSPTTNHSCKHSKIVEKKRGRRMAGR